MDRIRKRAKGIHKDLNRIKKEFDKLVKDLSVKCHEEYLEGKMDKIESFISQMLQELGEPIPVKQKEPLINLSQNQQLIQMCLTKRAIIKLVRLPIIKTESLIPSQESISNFSDISSSFMDETPQDAPFSFIDMDQGPNSNSGASEDTKFDLPDFQVPHTPKKRPKNRKCPFENCSETFISEVGLEFHKIRTHISPQFFTGYNKKKCPSCKKSYAVEHNLRHHIITVHFQIKLVSMTCSFPGCSKTFRDKKDLSSHERSHQVGHCICNKCGKSFNTFGKLDTHNAKFHRPLRCPRCPLTFAQAKTLKKHILGHDQTIVCEHCGKSMPSNDLYHHYFVHHRPVKCKIDGCGSEFPSRPDLKKHQDQFHAHKFICDVCGAGFHTQGDLNTHGRNHEVDFVCPFEGCGKGFSKSKKTNFKRHLKTHQRALDDELKFKDSRKYPCKICGKIYYHYTSLAGHRTMVHSKPPPKSFPCDEEGCGKTFKRMAYLLVHKNTIHNQTQDYSCKWPGCDKIFKNSMYARRHYNLMHT